MSILQPKLRFPKFEEDWENIKLGKISIKIGSGSTPSGGEKVYQKSGVIFIRSQNVNHNQLKLEDVTFISEEINSKMKGSIVIANDILLNITGASLGRSCVVPKSFTIGNVNQHVCIIRLNNTNNPYFIQLLLSSERGQKLIEEGQTGSGREGLNFQSIRNFNLLIPKISEQTKIANFLTAIDEKLQALQQKKHLLEQYKKGLLQQFFSQELRFKKDEDSDFPDWEEKKFDDIFEPIPSKKFQIQSNEIKDYGKYKVVDQGKKMIAGFSDKENSSFRNIPIIVFGDHTTILKYIDFEFIVGADGTKLLKNKSGNLKYLYYNLLFNNVEQEGYKRHFTILSEKYLQIPSLSEQQKIANFLSAIDEKIKAVSHQIEATQTYKKGLLQQMFC